MTMRQHQKKFSETPNITEPYALLAQDLSQDAENSINVWGC
ncbi:MAG: hypothetical protein RIR26_305 [Pseudomonadota bacterium]|jgi:hypothetical protein